MTARYLFVDPTNPYKLPPPPALSAPSSSAFPLPSLFHTPSTSRRFHLTHQLSFDSQIPPLSHYPLKPHSICLPRRLPPPAQLRPRAPHRPLMPATKVRSYPPVSPSRGVTIAPLYSSATDASDLDMIKEAIINVSSRRNAQIRSSRSGFPTTTTRLAVNLAPTPHSRSIWTLH